MPNEVNVQLAAMESGKKNKRKIGRFFGLPERPAPGLDLDASWKRPWEESINRLPDYTLG